MNALVLLVAASAVGVDVGWLPLSDGGVEYIIQIEPDLVDTLLRKNDLESSIPAGLDVRRFRVTVGTGKLPRQSPPAAAGARPGAAQPGAGQPTRAGDASSGAAGAGAGAQNSGAGSSGGGPAGVLPLGPVPASFPPASPGGAGPGGSGATSPMAVPPGGAGASAGGPGSPFSSATGAPGSAMPASSGSSGDGTIAAAGLASGGLASGESGPSLDSAGASPLGKKERDNVSRVLDDPRAPGRTAGADTGQPQLTQEEMTAARRPGGDMLAGGAGGLLASAHEANRPPEFDRGGNQNGAPLSGGFGSNNASASGGGRFGNSNDRGAGDRSENFNAAGGAAARPSEPAEKPWPTLIFTVTLLLVSVSLNLYLGWVAWDSRFRYRELLSQHGDLPLAV